VTTKGHKSLPEKFCL